MTNPFRGQDTIASRGRGGPGRSAGGGGIGPTGPTGPLPAFSDLGYWYDANQQIAFWQDSAGTIPILDNTEVNRADNLGFEIRDLENPNSVLRWQAAGGPANGPRIGAGSPSIQTEFPHTHPTMGPIATSWFGVGRHNTGTGSQGTIGLHKTSGLGGQILAQNIPAGPPFYRMDFCGSGFQSLDVTSLITDWIWIWATMNAAGNWRMQLSGKTEISGSGTYNPPQADSPLRIGGINADYTESGVWPNYELTNLDIADLIVYLDNRYGGPFPIP